jgi:hypothetical protein
MSASTPQIADNHAVHTAGARFRVWSYAGGGYAGWRFI